LCHRTGLYDPTRSPTLIQFRVEKLAAWLKKGAQPTQTVAQLIRKHEAAATTS
jgi:small subunit ribosomal protein S16